MAVVKKWAWDSNFNEWMNLAEFLHANTYLRKLKVTLIVIGGGTGSNMGVFFRSQDSITCCISRMNE